VAQPPPPPPPPGDETYVETTEAGPYPPGRRVVVDEAPPRRDIWPWLLAALLAAAAIVFLVLWLTHRHSGVATRRVPDLIGMRQTEAQSTASARSFRVTSVNRVAPSPAGTVLDQAPNPGAALEKGATVLVVVSIGRSQAKVPQLTGLKLAAAQRLADSVHLSVRTQTVTSDKPAGVVVSQQPAAGAQVPRGGDVLLSVSNGSNLSTVPPLQGLSLEKATAALAAAGLTGQVTQVASPQSEGTVIAQDPARGAKVKRGSTVRINVSTGPAAPSGGTTSVQTTTVSSTATVTVTKTVTTTEPAP
jgi:serine/threonine-protein kinase